MQRCAEAAHTAGRSASSPVPGRNSTASAGNGARRSASSPDGRRLNTRTVDACGTSIPSAAASAQVRGLVERSISFHWLPEGSPSGQGGAGGAHAQSAAVDNPGDLPTGKRTFRLALEVQHSPGSWAVRDVCRESPPVGNAGNGRVVAEFQLRDALLTLGEQRPGLLSKLPELINAACGGSELVAGVFLEADIRREKRKHAVDVKGVIGGQVAVYQLFGGWVFMTSLCAPDTGIKPRREAASA